MMKTPIEMIHAQIDPAAAIIKVTGEQVGHGLVLYVSPENYVTPFIVHCWAALDTAGDPIPPGALYSGSYHVTIEDALAVFETRSHD
jgi:hypothetical protein